MDLVTARARIHAMVTDTDGQATTELDQRLDDLIAVARTEGKSLTSDADATLGSCSECGQAPHEWCQGCAKCACVDRHDAGCTAA